MKSPHNQKLRLNKTRFLTKLKVTEVASSYVVTYIDISLAKPSSTQAPTQII